MKFVSCLCLPPAGWPQACCLTSPISVYSPQQKNKGIGLGNLDCKWSASVPTGIIPRSDSNRVTLVFQIPKHQEKPTRGETLQHVPGTSTHLSVWGLLCMTCRQTAKIPDLRAMNWQSQVLWKVRDRAIMVWERWAQFSRGIHVLPRGVIQLCWAGIWWHFHLLHDTMLPQCPGNSILDLISHSGTDVMGLWLFEQLSLVWKMLWLSRNVIDLVTILFLSTQALNNGSTL